MAEPTAAPGAPTLQTPVPLARGEKTPPNPVVQTRNRLLMGIGAGLVVIGLGFFFFTKPAVSAKSTAAANFRWRWACHETLPHQPRTGDPCRSPWQQTGGPASLHRPIIAPQLLICWSNRGGWGSRNLHASCETSCPSGQALREQ